MFAVVQNIAAGTARILEQGEQRDFHEDFVNEFETRELAQVELDLMRGEPIWVVFFNNAAHDAYVSKEDYLTGNWRGSRDYPYNIFGEYPTEAEAKAACAEYLKCDAAKRGEYCYSHNPR